MSYTMLKSSLMLVLVSASAPIWLTVILAIPAIMYFVSMTKTNVVNKEYERSWYKYFKSWYDYFRKSKLKIKK